MEQSSLFRAISLDKTLTQLQQQIELASKIGNYTFINEIAIENFIKNVIIINNNNNDESLLLFDKQYRNHINSLLSYLVYLFETNSDSNKQWLIHLMVRKFFDSKSNIDDIISNVDLKQKIRLLADQNYINLSIICSSKLPGLHPYAIDFYRRRKIMTIDNESLAEDNEIIQSLCVKLRNSLFQDPRTTAIVMNILAIVYDDQNFKCQSKTNYFEKIYSQALIHTLKNQNRQLMLKILLCCPDSVFDNDDDDNLIKQIIDCLRSLKTTTTTTTETTTSIKSLVESELVLMSLYSYGLFAHSKRFIQFIADISHQQRQYDNLIIDSDHRFFNLKQSFLLAVEDRKHFLRTFMDYYYSINLKQLDEMTISLSLKSRIILTILSLYHIINNHEDSGRMQEKISKIETNLCSMFEHLNHHQSETNRDEYFIRIVNKLDFVFKFADWCCSSSNSNNNNNLNHERSTFRLEIIAGLMTGTTPLKILSNYNFFHLNRSNNKDDNDDQLSINNDNICDNYICDLIEHFDHNMAIILKGFIIIRLVFSCIFFANDRINFLEKFITNISNRLQNLLQELNILEFRMEIMENLFCLLFLTKNDLKINDKNNGDNGNHHCFKSDDDEDYLDETISPTKSSNNVNNQKSNRHKSIMIQSISNFSTANFICPNWLIPKLLEVLETMLYKTNSDLFNSSKQQSTTATNDDNEIWQENLKRRISRLLEYVSDARFRYDVIRPAFFRQTSSSSTATTMMDSGLQSTDPEQSQQQQQMDYPNRHYSISTSSENDYKQQTNSDTSLISCMLASYQQLLCYTLAENRLDSSRQIAKLFANDLKNSKPYKELQLLDYFLEFHQQVCNIQQKFIDHSSINYQHHHDDNNEIGNNNNNQNRLKIDDITTFGIRSSCIQSLLYEMLMKMDTIEIETKIIFMLDYALSSSPSLEIAQSILESVFINNNNLFEQFKQSSSSTLDETNKILPEKVENFIHDIQKFIKNLGQHIDISQISLNEYLEQSLTLSSFMDVKIFIDTLQIETELCRWYYRFQSLLIEIEHQIIDDPDILLNSEQNQLNQIKSNDLNHIYDRLMANCPLGKYQYMKALYYYVCKVNNALVECRKRDIRIIDDDDNKHNQTIDTSMICSSSNFSILKQSPSAILCSMVIKSKISPKIIDDLAQVMKVNLIGVLCSVFCPTIPSTFLPHSSIEFTITELCQPSISELIKLYFQGAKIFHQKLNSNNIVINDYFADERQYDLSSSSSANINDSIDFQPIINQDVLNYFHSKCPILVEILRLLDWLDDSQIANITNIGSTNVQLFDGSPIHRWLDLIRKNFHYNDLRKSSLLLAFYARIPAGQNVVIKTLEHYTANRNFIQVYRLFRLIEDFSTIADQTPKQFSPLSTGHFYTSFQIFQNAILACLAFIKEDAKYIFQIHHDPRMKAELILCLLDSFEIYEQTFYATRLIRLGLQNIRNDELNFGIDVSEGKSKLTIMLKQIEFYASVGQLTGLKSWKSARNNLETIDVLTIIKTRKRYSLAIDWFDIHGFENDTADLLIELLIYAYSEQNDYILLKRLFQRFLDDPKSNNVIIITEKILNQTENLDLRIFLIDFLIQFHRKCGSYVMIDQYERHRLGIEMVRLLSRKIQSDYLDLIPIPLLIVEQLLMNSEIESLDRIINQYKLICADDLVEKYAQKSVYIELYDSNSFDGSDMTIISSDSSMMMAGKNVQPFFIPQTIPSKDQWVSDQSKTHCMLCQIVRFGMINRRHHCRRCGRIVCNGCSSNAILIIEINPNIPVRVCDDCFNWSTKIQTNRKISTNSLDQQQQQQSMSSNNCRTQWKLSIVDDTYNQNRRSEFSYESSPSVSLCLAILRLHSNKTKSCKFIIDKICAPLIETISSRNVDSTLLIEMIRSLLISTRVAFDDDDHHSINNNNTNQSSSSSSSDIEQLNRYLDRLDVIRMLINANYGSKEMIGLVLNNNIQKLQEKLLEAERFELTIDIAKKYGYEYSSIWKSWALISLKYFHFAEARQKFGRYFDQVKRFSDIQKTLHMIIETLVSVNSTSLTTISIKDKCSRIIFGQFDFFTDTTALAHNTSNSSKMVNNTNISTLVNHQLKPRILQEIVYYLETYGSKDDQLQFYVSHFYWKEAIDSFLRQPPSSSSSSSSTNVKETKSNMVNNFLEKIFIPAQINGHLSELFAAIRLIDPKQQQLGSSLIHICKYLDRNESFHTLYRVQIFMNDYLRAAITQINHFFLSSTILFTNFQSSNDLNQSNNNNHDQDLNNFELLFNRISYLEKAKDYCNMYLHNFDFIRLKRGCLSVDKKDVYKQIRLIELQIDILRRFRRRKILFPVTIIMNNDNVDELENQFKKSKTYRSSSSTPLILSAYALAYLQRQIWQQFSSSSSLMEQTEQKSSSSLRLPYPPTLLEHDPIRKSLITGFDHHLNEKLIFRMCTMFLIAQHLERNSNVEKISNDLRQLLSFIQPTLSSSKATINVDDNDDKNDGNNDNKDRLDSEKISISSQKIEQLSTDDIIFDLLHFIESIMTVLIRLSNSQLDPITIINGLTRSKLSELKESIIKLIVDDNRRIDAYLQVGKLKLAYLLAAQLGLAANIEHVLMAARNANDQHYVKICEMWLKKNTATTMI
ncbi:Zinc finger FYVE domain-containing protein 26 [Dermatophagoides pteronyssinus]|uniref:Zinc finger FYVE domain-containing protein 26 n=1 Tax=Dermatophagoides pteronyssinus TaxID=6956 RepID=A0ABQ8JIV7_DERPT|nr:Zinc finger FYVE domain-containing protein 26 [Dermatophagoides pteronyssinus]